jgi:hypothetical protein
VPLGRGGRAIDLAFEHFAKFGPDRALIRLLGDAAREPAVPERVRRRFAELCDAAT